jgi:hypothetical protein
MTFYEGTSLIMTVQELEHQLLGLPPTEKLRIIQILAQSLDSLWSDKNQDSPAKLSEFFANLLWLKLRLLET